MKVKTSKAGVEKLIGLLETSDDKEREGASAFLNALPTPEKYAILAMALVVQGGYEDFEIAYDESMHRVSAQELTKHLIAFERLNEHLRDAIGLGWQYFEFLWSDDDDEDEDGSTER